MTTSESPRSVRWILATGLLYVLGYLPAAATLAFVEGALRGLWEFSAAEWEYQVGAFAAYFAGLFLLSGVVALPLLLAMLTLWGRRSRAANAIYGAVFAPLLLIGIPTSILYFLSVVLGDPSPKAALLLLSFPLGFPGAAVLYGAGVAAFAPIQQVRQPNAA